MISPIDQAKALTPFWMMEIFEYDGLEIHPVQELTDSNGSRFCEQCEAHEAQFWSVYGHLKEGGVKCFEDFETEEQAQSFAQQLYKTYPHLRGGPFPECPVWAKVVLYAQPYDISAQGFFFASTAEYREKAENLRNSAGQPVEEFEIQFIDGEEIDALIFRALSIHQGNFHLFFEKAGEWEEWEKYYVILAVGECGYGFDMEKDDPKDFDIDLYEIDSMRELAEQFVEDGLFGDIPEHLQNYIDYDAIARDLSIDYSETRINGHNLIYRCS